MATAHSKFGEESQETRAEMANEASTQTHHVEDVEIRSGLSRWTLCWKRAGDVAREILERLRAHATVMESTCLLRRTRLTRTRFRCGWSAFSQANQELERRIKSLIRWNALAMLVRANREEHNIGGHIRLLLRRPRFMRLGSIISGAGGARRSKATRFIFKTRGARNVRARVHGRATEQREAGEFPA